MSLHAGGARQLQTALACTDRGHVEVLVLTDALHPLHFCLATCFRKLAGRRCR